MRSRWLILAVLFLIRAIMAVQFQAVAAIAPLLSGDLGADLADIGLLIGIYMAPGVALALPGGAIGRRFGDKTTVLFGLTLMMAGGVMMALSASWSGQIAGRLVAGTGGVFLSVLMAKMVADWFGDQEISTAMAIFMNSWPVGLAIALTILPPIGAAHGASAVYFAVTMLAAIGFVLLALWYEPPPTSLIRVAASASLDRKSAIAVFVAAIIWSLYNIGFGMILSFGPSMLVERGRSIADAGSTTSIVLWLGALSTLLGGVLADQTKRHNLILAASCVIFALLLILAPRSDSVVLAFVALGIVSGLPVGSITSLPVRLLAPGARAMGMGLFYTVFYFGLMLGPALGGKYAIWAGTAGAAFDFGAAAVLLCPVILFAFVRFPEMVLRPARSLNRNR